MLRDEATSRPSFPPITVLITFRESLGQSDQRGDILLCFQLSIVSRSADVGLLRHTLNHVWTVNGKRCAATSIERRTERNIVFEVIIRYMQRI